MLINASGKNIDTLPFQNLLVQGEKLSEKIIFKVDRYYNDKDISPCIFMIKGVNEQNEIAEQVLNVTENIEFLELEWNVSSLFTTSSGRLDLEIQALSSVDGELSYLLKYILPPVYIRKAVNGENIPTPDLSEQVISEINTVVADGLQIINEKIGIFEQINERIDNIENDINNLEAEIKIKAMTLEEYDSEIHSDNILYVII